MSTRASVKFIWSSFLQNVESSRPKMRRSHKFSNYILQTLPKFWMVSTLVWKNKQACPSKWSGRSLRIKYYYHYDVKSPTSDTRANWPSKWPRFSLTHWQPTICFNGKIFAKFARFAQNSANPDSQSHLEPNNNRYCQKYFSILNDFGIIGTVKYNLHWHCPEFFQLKIHGW